MMMPDPDEVEAPRAASARVDVAVRGEVPRGGGARAAVAAPADWRTHAVVAAAQARGGSARRRGAFRLVPDGARSVSRVAARRLRHAGAGRHAQTDPARQLRVVTVDSTTPSPFAASLLFGYVANYIYDGDAPLAERRAQALSIDHAQLKTLLGDAELRELLDMRRDRSGRATESVNSIRRAA